VAIRWGEIRNLSSAEKHSGMGEFQTRREEIIKGKGISGFPLDGILFSRLNWFATCDSNFKKEFLFKRRGQENQFERTITGKGCRVLIARNRETIKEQQHQKWLTSLLVLRKNPAEKKELGCHFISEEFLFHHTFKAKKERSF